MKILIVDDSGSMRKIIISTLSTHSGITRCDEASNGKQAITAICRTKYDLIFMDWNMPEMSGIEALRIIRNLGKKIPIIMTTVNNERKHLLEALKAGADNYIVKPFTPDVLLTKFRETIIKSSKQA